MEIIKIDYEKPSPLVVRKTVKIIKSGGLVIVPTDTVYAIFGNSLDHKTLKKIYQLKQRSPKKRFLLGLYPFEKIYKYVEYNPLISKILKRFPDLKISFGLPRKQTLPSFLNPGFNLVTFRFFFNNLDKELFKHISVPLVGTSANISGRPNAFSVAEVVENFRPIFGTSLEPDLILDGGKLTENNPSTIIELLGNDIRIIREGNILAEKLQKELNKIIKSIR